MHTAETGFNLILAALQQHLKCLIAFNTYSVYTEDMLMGKWASLVLYMLAMKTDWIMTLITIPLPSC